MARSSIENFRPAPRQLTHRPTKHHHGTWKGTRAFPFFTLISPMQYPCLRIVQTGSFGMIRTTYLLHPWIHRCCYRYKGTSRNTKPSPISTPQPLSLIPEQIRPSEPFTCESSIYLPAFNSQLNKHLLKYRLNTRLR